MKKKKKKINKIWIFNGILVVIVLLILSILLNRKTGTIEGILKDSVVLVQKVVMYPFTALKNVDNKNQSESYIIQKNMNESLEKEIEELKKALELNKTLTEYEPINATILSRNKSYWFQTITIDKGKSSGIKENMAVITKEGFIGKITKVSNYSSEVKLITANDKAFKVSITIKTNGVDTFAVMNGYDKKSGLLMASGIDKTAKINVGDSVLTSGLGEMFPSGIYIGTIEKIEEDKYNLSKSVTIKTLQNFNEIHYVTVLKVKS